MSKEKRFSPLPSEGPSTSKVLKYETSEDNKTQATLLSNFEELPSSSGFNVINEPMETEITNNNLKYCEEQFSCDIHIAAEEYKREKPKLKKQTDQDLKEISKHVCALLNDVGGIVRLRNVQFASATSQDLDTFSGKLVDKLKALVPNSNYGEFFDFVGSFQNEELLVHVKKFSSNVQGRTSFVKTNLFVRNDHGVEEAHFEKVHDLLTEKYSKLKEKDSKEIKYHLEELPIIPEEFIYGSKLKDFQESKRIEFKAARGEGIAVIQDLKDKIKSNISGFANMEGGHIFIGVENDHTIKGINCKGEEKEITEEITRMIQKMKWGSGSLAPVEDVHWKITLSNVQNSPDDGVKVIVISVAGLNGIGGVYVADPESYKVDVKDLVASVKRLTLDDLQGEVNKNQDFLTKVPPHFRTNKSSFIATVEGSRDEIRESCFKMEKDCPLVPEGFSTEGMQVIRQVQELCKDDMGIIVGAKSWKSFLGGKTEEGVVCDILLINENKGNFFYTVARNGDDVSDYNLRTATFIKRKLVESGHVFEKFFVTCRVIPLDCNPNDKIFEQPKYPDSYKKRSSSSLLNALVVAVASYPSILANHLGLTFLNLLTKPQFEILWKHAINSTRSHKLFVSGIAGTGKTCLAVALMDYLKQRDGLDKENILYICENEGLRRSIEKMGIAQTVRRKMFMTDFEFPNAKHVVVDEAQNFRNEDGKKWFPKAEGLAKRDKGYFWLFLDMNQKSHKFETGLPEEQQPSFVLDGVIRNSINILFFNVRHLRADEKPVKISHNFRGDKVSHHFYHGETKAYLRVLLMNLNREGHRNHEIAVLFAFEKILNDFDTREMTFDTEENNSGERLILTTVERYSGLERPVVIFIEDSEEKKVVRPDGYDYSACSRANVKFIILERVPESEKARIEYVGELSIEDYNKMWKFEDS